MTERLVALPKKESEVIEHIRQINLHAKSEYAQRSFFKRKGNKVYMFYGYAKSKEEGDKYVKRHLQGIDAIVTELNKYNYVIWVR